MLKEQRIEQIKTLLARSGSVEISQLCELFGVAPMTVRRDLDQMEKSGVIVRTHGGARLVEKQSLQEPPFDERLKLELERKRAVARAANETICGGERIFIGSGSTVHLLTAFLNNFKKLVVVTNSLRIASELAGRANITLIVIGGEVRSNTLTTAGVFADEMAGQFRCDKAYMGAGAVDGDGNIYLGSTADVGIFNAHYKYTPECYLMLDSTKLGKQDFVQVGSLKKATTLITNGDAPPELIDRYREMGADVLLA